MDGAFDDEGEPAVTIGEYLDAVEERELVSHFLHCYYTFIYGSPIYFLFASHLVGKSIVMIYITAMNYM